MFTERAQIVIDRAGEEALARGNKFLDLESLLAALSADPEGSVRLAECLTGGDVDKLRAACPRMSDSPPRRGRLDFDESAKRMIKTAYQLASVEGVPDPSHPGFINVRHLACAAAISGTVCRELLGGLTPLEREKALQLLAGWSVEGAMSGSIGSLVNNLRGLRGELLERVFGQDHAVHAFVEGLYNAEVTASIDQERKKPAAVFVFAGPPGVGKTYLAELSASFLERPFRRFDMTAYSDHQAHNQLVGFARSYQGAHPGLVTGFVAKNPNAILLFDEIEKAHLNTMQLFYQILDAGRLEDKFTEEEVNFRDTIIIFTTNAGRSLYDNPNRAGIGAANAGYHRRTILSALEQEKNPTTGLPAFPTGDLLTPGSGLPADVQPPGRQRADQGQRHGAEAHRQPAGEKILEALHSRSPLADFAGFSRRGPCRRPGTACRYRKVFQKRAVQVRRPLRRRKGGRYL
jgi:ATP-dependent Clp protease ATP-binding subunit ClpA